LYGQSNAEKKREAECERNEGGEKGFKRKSWRAMTRRRTPTHGRGISSWRQGLADGKKCESAAETSGRRNPVS